MKHIEKQIGHAFKNPALLQQALTHPSHHYEQESETGDNQRLEFLGDAVIGFLLASYYFRSMPDSDEGYLTTIRSRLGSTRHLADLAREIGLGQHLRLGRGESASGGGDRESNLADALEALFGAVYIDSGMRAAERVFKTLFKPGSHHPDALTADQNPKGQVQEWCQKHLGTTPTYRIKDEAGPPHEKQYAIELVIRGTVVATGEGPSKRAAETDAAGALLQRNFSGILDNT